MPSLASLVANGCSLTLLLRFSEHNAQVSIGTQNTPVPPNRIQFNSILKKIVSIQKCFSIKRPLRQIIMRFFSSFFFFFFRSDSGFSANRRRFTPAKPRSRPCAAWNEFTYERYPTQKSASPPVQFEWLPTSRNLTQKYEAAANPKTGLFPNEGQLQTTFRRTMHRGQKLELRLWRSGLLSWVPLGETALIPRNVWLISSVYRSKTDMSVKNVQIEPNKIRCA